MVKEIVRGRMIKGRIFKPFIPAFPHFTPSSLHHPFIIHSLPNKDKKNDENVADGDPLGCQRGTPLCNG
jgi:hypothetical protein